MDSMKELLNFLQPHQRIDLKAVSINNILSLTGTAECKKLIFDYPDIIKSIFELSQDKTETIAKDAVLSLINLSAQEEDAIKLYNTSKNLTSPFEIVQAALAAILDENSSLSDPWTMVLSNLTRVENLVLDILYELTKDDKTIPSLVKAFNQIDYNKKKAKLHYLGPIFCNLAQTKRGREIICNPKQNYLNKILSFATFNDSLVRRGGTIGFLKNICFDSIYHELILSDRDDVLFALLYPLIGSEEFTDEEYEKFPIQLQYMGDEKQREIDSDLRIMLLESLLQLCATKKYREFLRSKGTYEILREYHKWEDKIGGDKNALLMCENVVDILIKKEDEIALDNYKEIEVPDDISKKFLEDDANYLAE